MEIAYSIDLNFHSVIQHACPLYMQQNESMWNMKLFNTKMMYLNCLYNLLPWQSSSHASVWPPPFMYTLPNPQYHSYSVSTKNSTFVGMPTHSWNSWDFQLTVHMWFVDSRLDEFIPFTTVGCRAWACQLGKWVALGNGWGIKWWVDQGWIQVEGMLGKL